MVANYRCNEIKQEALDLVAGGVDTLRKESEASFLPDF